MEKGIESSPSLSLSFGKEASFKVGLFSFLIAVRFGASVFAVKE